MNDKLKKLSIGLFIQFALVLPIIWFASYDVNDPTTVLINCFAILILGGLISYFFSISNAISSALVIVLGISVLKYDGSYILHIYVFEFIVLILTSIFSKNKYLVPLYLIYVLFAIILSFFALEASLLLFLLLICQFLIQVVTNSVKQEADLIVNLFSLTKTSILNFLLLVLFINLVFSLWYFVFYTISPSDFGELPASNYDFESKTDIFLYFFYASTMILTTVGPTFEPLSNLLRIMIIIELFTSILLIGLYLGFLTNRVYKHFSE